MFTPLPFRPGKGGFGDLFRMHIFVNAGDLGDVYLGKRLLFSSVMNICICQFIVSFVFTGGKCNNKFLSLNCTLRWTAPSADEVGKILGILFSSVILVQFSFFTLSCTV